ncbi:hypothetical protein FA95DRAFT_76978 [Auriscalpium vulgare]|uniref:Uncharacterized protein n=1 Tax=Auriscalpium vulgare TaxID=40419 RepID=A0ACB8RPS2_9AGAM|nr:hypothetical protein FA95DRAFT_76978 [Auriscalpium vulgare]
MGTWAQPAHRHPWFKTAPKRKLSLSPSPASSASPSPPSDDGVYAHAAAQPHAREPVKKRQRLAALEHGLAGLNLVPPNVNLNANAQWRAPPPDDLSPMDLSDEPVLELSPSSVSAPDGDIVRTTDIEEPPELPEVRMRSSSWYEPEKDRIVITDLDASSDEEADDAVGHSVAPAFLARLRRTLAGPAPMLPPPGEPADARKALVLFRPLGPPGRADDGPSPPPASPEPPTPPDDAMDIEL